MEEVPIDLAEAVIPHHQQKRGTKATTSFVAFYKVGIYLCNEFEKIAGQKDYQ